MHLIKALVALVKLTYIFSKHLHQQMITQLFRVFHHSSSAQEPLIAAILTFPVKSVHTLRADNNRKIESSRVKTLNSDYLDENPGSIYKLYDLK
jgi:hypothetical protein